MEVAGLETTQAPKAVRDHLFISYAVEDRPLAEWLTRKLTADGYLVWCDCFSLLAGESYPRRIDEAIKQRTFRVLAILSESSIHKPNPTKERTLALNLARERCEDFLIPLNVNLSATQMDWMTSDLNYIPFVEWASGYAQLLKTLSKINAPRLLDDGRAAAIETFNMRPVVSSQGETLYSNCIPFSTIPQVVRAFTTNRGLTRQEFTSAGASKVAYQVNPRTYLTFERALNGLPSDVLCKPAGQFLWDAHTHILGVRSLNVVSSLLNKRFLATCLKKGLKQTEDGKSVFFPHGVVREDKLHFSGFAGKTWILVVGQRMFRKLEGEREVCIHHLAFRWRVRQQLLELPFVLQLRVGLYLTDLSGVTFKPRKFNSRRKKITKNWWNDKWLNRHIAICSFLDDGGGICLLGDDETTRAVLSTELVEATAPISIDENALVVERAEFDLNTVESELIEIDEDEGFANTDE